MATTNFTLKEQLREQAGNVQEPDHIHFVRRPHPTDLDEAQNYKKIGKIHKSPKKTKNHTLLRNRDVKKIKIETQGLFDFIGAFSTKSGGFDTLGKDISKISSLADRIQDPELVEFIRSNTTKIVDAIDNFSSNGVKVESNHKFDLESIFKTVLENVDTIGIVLLVVVSCSLLSRGGAKSTILSISALGSLLVLKYYGAEMIDAWQDICHKLDNHFPKRCGTEVDIDLVDIETQSAVDIIPLLKILCTCTSLFMFRDFKTSGVLGYMDHLISCVRTAPRRWESTQESFGFYIHAVQDICNEICRLLSVDKSFRFAIDKIPEAARLIDEVDDFITTSKDSRSMAVNTAYRTMTQLNQKILDILKKYAGERSFTGYANILRDQQRKLESISSALDLRGQGKAATRVPPVAFCFLGQPGIGKSYWLDNISIAGAAYIYRDQPERLKELLVGGQERDFIHSRNSVLKHWEGYYNQSIVILDEVGLTKDSVGVPAENNPYAQFIQMNNDTTMTLPMAELSKKGKFEFDSDVIIGTANIEYVTPESLSEPKAYDRRWRVFETTVDPRYGCHYKGDPTKHLVPDFEKIKAAYGFEGRRERIEELRRESSELNEWLAHSGFLQFRERVSWLHGPPNMKYVQDAPMSSFEVLKLFEDALSHRENVLKPGKATQKKCVNDFYARKYGIETQSNDCECKVCKASPYFGMNEDDLKYMNTFLSGCRELGFNHDLRFDYEAYSCGYCSSLDDGEFQPVCIKDLVYRFGPDVTSGEVSHDFGRGVRSIMNKTCYRNYNLDLAKRVAKIIGVIAGGFTAAFGIYKLVSYMFGSSKKEPDVEVQYIDRNSEEVLHRVLNRNTYQIIIPSSSHQGFAMFITDNILVVPRHYVLHYRRILSQSPDFKVTFKRIGDGCDHRTFQVDASSLCKASNVFAFADTGVDMVAVRIDDRVTQCHASIRKYLYPTLNKVKGCMLFPKIDRDDLSTELLGSDYDSMPCCEYKDKHGVEFRSKSFIQYRIATETGDCGVPVSIVNRLSTEHKIYGIHVAGSPSIRMGFAAPLTVEMFDRIVNHFLVGNCVIESQAYQAAGPHLFSSTQLECGSFDDLPQPTAEERIPGKLCLAKLPAPRIPTSTQIEKSRLHNQFGFISKTCPAWLRPFDDKNGNHIDPNAIATTKYHKSSPGYVTKALDACVVNYTDLVVNIPFIRNDDRISRRVLSFEEAVAGIPGVSGFDGIPRKTSAGYPWCMSAKGSGKKHMFGEEGDYIFDTPDCDAVRRSVEHIVHCAKRRIRLPHVFMDFPKDERRPKDKVWAGKTRKISACPVDLNISIRMYFGAFCQFYMANRIVNQSAVGINAYSDEWDSLVYYMGEERKIIAGDYSNYDGKLPYEVMTRFLDTISAYYRDHGSENELVRKVLFQEIVNSRHIYHTGVVYEWVGSNASGNPLTSILNTWCNNVLLRYACLIISDNLYGDHQKYFRLLGENVKFMCYGDDNIISVALNNFGTPYTQKAFTDALGVMGLDYTDESKGDGSDLSQDRRFCDVSFLKRGFRKVDLYTGRRYLAPLALDSILETPMYTRKKDVEEEVVRENIRNSILELSYHPVEVFEEWAPRLREASERILNYTPLPNKYDECLEVMLKRT